MSALGPRLALAVVATLVAAAVGKETGRACKAYFGAGPPDDWAPAPDAGGVDIVSPTAECTEEQQSEQLLKARFCQEEIAGGNSACKAQVPACWWKNYCTNKKGSCYRMQQTRRVGKQNQGLGKEYYVLFAMCQETPNIFGLSQLPMTTDSDTAFASFATCDADLCNAATGREPSLVVLVAAAVATNAVAVLL